MKSNKTVVLLFSCVINVLSAIDRNKKETLRTIFFCDVKSLLCEPDRIRTCDRLLRREVLYPAELRAHSRTSVLKMVKTE